MAGKIAVALSGGIDSAVAAAILKEQGYEVLGLYLWLSDGQEGWTQVQAVGRRLHLTVRQLDLRAAFRQEVIDYFGRSYQAGQTPNPCVRCNERIKFGRLLQLVREWGLEALATGHYARIQPDAAGRWGLWRGFDRQKDQSYFLHRLPLPVLPQILLPLGELTKTRVQEVAQELGLNELVSPEESQELCFMGQGNYRDFLQTLGVTKKENSGWFVDLQGQPLGRHRGLACYTVGQRRGLGLCGREPYYVVELRPETNEVVVGPKEALASRGLVAQEVNWLIPPPEAPIPAVVQVRYRHRGVRSLLTPLPGNKVRVEFQEPQGPVAPGQAAVFYDGDRVLGGGWICRRLEAAKPQVS